MNFTQLSVLDDMAKAVFEANAQKGFWEVPADVVDKQGIVSAWYPMMKKAEKIALMHSELSEGLEGVRKNSPSDHLEGFLLEEEEMADVFIRLMDYCGGFNIRLAEAVHAKLAFNANRPHKHGKAF